MEAKTKSGFSIIQLVEIPENYLRKGVLKELSGRELYVDADEELGEQIFSGDIFTQIECEVEEGLKISPDDLKQIQELSKELGKFELVRINKI